MDKVTVNKAELITKLEENRANHAQLLSEALAAYKKGALLLLDRKIKAVKAGKRVRNVSFNIPTDHTRDYDHALDMLKMSVDEQITLSQQDFRQYVRDEWFWKQDFQHIYASNVALASGAVYDDEIEEDEE